MHDERQEPARDTVRCSAPRMAPCVGRCRRGLGFRSRCSSPGLLELYARPSVGAAQLVSDIPAGTAQPIGCEVSSDLKMKIKFGAQFGFLASPLSHPPNFSEERSHKDSGLAGFTTRATAREKASHLLLAASSSRFPLAVSW